MSITVETAFDRMFGISPKSKKPITWKKTIYPVRTVKKVTIEPTDLERKSVNNFFSKIDLDDSLDAIANIFRVRKQAGVDVTAKGGQSKVTKIMPGTDLSSASKAEPVSPLKVSTKDITNNATLAVTEVKTGVVAQTTDNLAEKPASSDLPNPTKQKNTLLFIGAGIAGILLLRMVLK